MKKAISFVLSALLCLSLFAQEEETTEVVETIQAPPVETGADEEVKNYRIFVTAGPMLLVNTDSSTNSAPSPIMFSGAIGTELFKNKPVWGEARLSYFTNYYFWDGEDARPAEVENRTATLLSFMIDLCGIYPIKKGENIFGVGGGLGFLARYGVLSNGVDEDDSGFSDTETASDDVSNINSWLWESGRFLYPQFAFHWERDLGDTDLSAGIDFRYYLPLGSLISGNGLDASIFTLTFRLGL